LPAEKKNSRKDAKKNQKTSATEDTKYTEISEILSFLAPLRLCAKNHSVHGMTIA